MKKGAIFIIILTGIFLLSFCIAAELPRYEDPYVNDFAGVFSASEVYDLRVVLDYVKQNTTAEMVIVTDNECASHGGSSQYAFDLARAWGVGKSDKDNGLLVLYCKEENKIWVTVGYGLEGILPDSKIGRMLDENYVPFRDAGNVSEGIIQFTLATVDVLEENKEEIKSGLTSGSSGGLDIWVILFILFWIYIVVSAILSSIFKNRPRSSLPWFIPLFLPSSRSSGGFGGGGFSGGGFGGGGFGGGGAGR